MASTIRCDIVSAEAEIFHGEAELVVATGELGERNGVFAFASELSALLRHRRIDAEIDLLAVQKYFAHGFIPAPHALYRGCRKLPGGWRMSVDLASRRIAASPYWRFRLNADPKLEERSEEELAEELRALLFEAVRRRLISDVPLGLFRRD